MTDADALSELVRAGLRNPARIVVKVQAKRKQIGSSEIKTELIEDRRLPAKYVFCLDRINSSDLFSVFRTIISSAVHRKRLSSSAVSLHTSCHKRGQRTSSSISRHARVWITFTRSAHHTRPNGMNQRSQILPAVTQNATFFSIHGNLTPSARTRTLQTFTTQAPSPGNALVLLATDVAARGLDLPNVDCVIQFDPPTDTKAFSHRCGRTARAGRSGTAWTLLCGREIELIGRF